MTKAELDRLSSEINRLRNMQLEQFENKRLSSVNDVSKRLKKLTDLYEKEKK